MPKQPLSWPPEQEWEPEPLYLPAEPPQPPPEEEDPDERQQAPSTVIIIDIACPEGSISMC